MRLCIVSLYRSEYCKTTGSVNLLRYENTLAHEQCIRIYEEIKLL